MLLTAKGMIDTVIGRSDSSPFDELSDASVVSVVGNGPVHRPQDIDVADIVLRFNKAPHCGKAGRRTDILVLVNWSLAGDEFARKPHHINWRARLGARGVLLTNHPTEIDEFRAGREAEMPGDRTEAICKKIVRNRPVEFLPASNRRACASNLIAFGATSDVIPSTGAQIINFLMVRCPKARLSLYGFSHQGWEGHCWDAERSWIRSLESVQTIERSQP